MNAREKLLNQIEQCLAVVNWARTQLTTAALQLESEKTLIEAALNTKSTLKMERKRAQDGAEGW